MDFAPDANERAFREEVRQFLREELPPELAARTLAGEFNHAAETLAWQKILYAKGWGAPTWPVAFGGTGWSALQIMIFEEESRLAGAPTQNLQGTALLGPVVIEFGTDRQRAELLQPLLRGEALWCQGFSEPGAGSDLASLRTAAQVCDDGFVVNGSKIWTTSAHEATHFFLLARTERTERKHEGISFLVGEMSTPGITVRPIHSIDGEHHLNETFFDDVRLPPDALIGQLGAGWAIARFLLNNERITGMAGLKGAVARFGQLCDQLGGGTARSGWAAVERAAIELELKAIDMFARRLISLPRDAGITTSVLSSTFKILLSTLYQRTTRATVTLAREQAVTGYFDPTSGFALAGDYFYSRAVSIYGGANEVQKNVISRAVLKG